MGFRSVWLQRLPFFDQVIAIFEKDLENIDVSRPFLPVSDLMKHERGRPGIFSKPFRATNIEPWIQP